MLLSECFQPITTSTLICATDLGTVSAVAVPVRGHVQDQPWPLACMYKHVYRHILSHSPLEQPVGGSDQLTPAYDREAE